MMTHLWDRGRRYRVRLQSALVALLVAVAGIHGAGAQGEGLADQAHSLRAVPADAAFYSTSLRLKEQWDIFLASTTYERLMEVPLMQLAKMQIEFQWQQNPDATLAKIRDYFQSDEGAQTRAIVRQMFSAEVFLYGGEDMGKVLLLFAELNAINRAAGIEA